MTHDGIRRSRVVRTSGVYARYGYGARSVDFGSLSLRAKSIVLQAMGAAKTLRSQWAWMVFLATLANGCSGKAFSNRSEPSWDSYDSGTQTENETGGTSSATRSVTSATGGTQEQSNSSALTGGAGNIQGVGGSSHYASTLVTGGSTAEHDAGCLCRSADQCDPRSVACNLDTPKIRTASNCRFDDQLCPTETPIYCWQC